MKVIDLLNKIANGEEVRFKILDDNEIKDEIFEVENGSLRNRTCGKWLETRVSLDTWEEISSYSLNKEVEVIEEDKFEYIDQIHNDDHIPQKYNSKIKNTNLIFTDLDRITWYKVNELIDEVNELRKVIYDFKNIEELDIDLYTTEGGIRTAKKINEIIDKIYEGE